MQQQQHEHAAAARAAAVAIERAAKKAAELRLLITTLHAVLNKFASAQHLLLSCAPVNVFAHELNEMFSAKVLSWSCVIAVSSSSSTAAAAATRLIQQTSAAAEHQCADCLLAMQLLQLLFAFAIAAAPAPAPAALAEHMTQGAADPTLETPATSTTAKHSSGKSGSSESRLSSSSIAAFSLSAPSLSMQDCAAADHSPMHSLQHDRLELLARVHAIGATSIREIARCAVAMLYVVACPVRSTDGCQRARTQHSCNRAMLMALHALLLQCSR
eukprot:16770-Heterococcus_DN1.PRE.1